MKEKTKKSCNKSYLCELIIVYITKIIPIMLKINDVTSVEACIHKVCDYLSK